MQTKDNPVDLINVALGSHPNWGYSGSGPVTLAELAYTLFADITAEAASVGDAAPDGLYELFWRDWPGSTVLTRAQLEAARDA